MTRGVMSLTPRACARCDRASSASASGKRVDVTSSRRALRRFASASETKGALTTHDERDEEYMRQALEAAASRTAEEVHPNPLVGCVVVDPRADVVVGRGFHPRAGEPHAEVFALRAAGELARGATAYVTLEPCNHFGRTPPCARALVDAGVKRVVVGFVDPDPRVSGGGIQTLLDAGIDVAVGCEEARCREINADFIARQEAGR